MSKFVTSDDGVLVLGLRDEREPAWLDYVPYDPAHRPAAAVPLVRYHAPASFLNISTRRIGGLRFIKIGRLCLSFCITRDYRSL
jgi:hypothetical protein